MPAGDSAAVPFWARILRFPLIRIGLLGYAMLSLMMISNGFMEKFKATPLLSIAVTIGMVAAAIAIYAGYALFLERRPSMNSRRKAWRASGASALSSAWGSIPSASRC